MKLAEINWVKIDLHVPFFCKNYGKHEVSQQIEVYASEYFIELIVILFGLLIQFHSFAVECSEIFEQTVTHRKKTGLLNKWVEVLEGYLEFVYFVIAE